MAPEPIVGQTTVYDFLDDDECAWVHLSLAWAVWTLDYIAPDTASFSKWSPTRSDVPSWLSIGRTFRDTTTCEPSTGDRGAGESTFLPAASRAKTLPSPDGASDSTAEGQAFSSTSPVSQMTLLEKADLFWSKTCRRCFHRTVGEISPSFSRRWPNSGFATTRGEYWIAVTSECHNGGADSSSLADVVMADVARRFFLTPKAAAGILKRSKKRKKFITDSLRAALIAHAGSLLTPEELPDPWGTGREDLEPPTLTASAPMSVRRLTPTEFERLQGFPDGWTVVPGWKTPRRTRRATAP